MAAEPEMQDEKGVEPDRCSALASGVTKSNVMREIGWNCPQVDRIRPPNVTLETVTQCRQMTRSSLVVLNWGILLIAGEQIWKVVSFLLSAS